MADKDSKAKSTQDAKKGDQDKNEKSKGKLKDGQPKEEELVRYLVVSAQNAHEFCLEWGR